MAQEEHDKKSGDAAITSMKRALSGDLGAYFDSQVLSEDYRDNINSYNKIRRLIRKFFFNPDRKRLWLSIVDMAEFQNLLLWDHNPFIKYFRNVLIFEYGLKIEATRDTFVILSDMMEQREGEGKDVLRPVKFSERIPHENG